MTRENRKSWLYLKPWVTCTSPDCLSFTQGSSVLNKHKLKKHKSKSRTNSLHRLYRLFLAWVFGRGVYLNHLFSTFPVWLLLSKELIWQTPPDTIPYAYIIPEINTWWHLFGALGRPSAHSCPRFNWWNLGVGDLLNKGFDPMLLRFQKYDWKFPRLRNTTSSVKRSKWDKTDKLSLNSQTFQYHVSVVNCFNGLNLA